MYLYRKLSPEERARLLAERRRDKKPLHDPAHLGGWGTYLLTAANYLHRPALDTPERRLSFEGELLTGIAQMPGTLIHAWCVLPNHYHVLAYVDMGTFKPWCGDLHNGTSTRWNKEDGRLGRRVWYRFVDRLMRSERHFWATVNYVHQNPVKHGCSAAPEDWPTSSYAAFLGKHGEAFAEEIRRGYPIDRYGEMWDP